MPTIWHIVFLTAVACAVCQESDSFDWEKAAAETAPAGGPASTPAIISKPAASYQTDLGSAACDNQENYRPQATATAGQQPRLPSTDVRDKVETLTPRGFVEECHSHSAAHLRGTTQSHLS